MVKLSIKGKMILGSLTLFALVIVLSTTVVSTLMRKQSRGASNDLLQKSLNIIRDDLLSKEQKLLSFGRQAASAQMAANLKYLHEAKVTMNADMSMLKSTNEEIVAAIAQIGMAALVSSLSVYGNDGDLIAFFVKEDNASIAGYRTLAPKPAYWHIRLAPGQNIEPGAWKVSEALSEVKAMMKFRGEVPQKEDLWVDSDDGFVQLAALVPIVGVDYATGKTQEKQFGLAMVVQQLDQSFLSKMSDLTGMPITLFGADGANLGGLETYTKISDDLNLKKPDIRSLDRQSYLFNEVNLNEDRYFQGILPLAGSNGRVCAATALYSKRHAEENVRQIIRLLALAYLSCMLLIIPLVIFFSNSLTRPIHKVVDGLTDISKGEGNLTKRLDVKGDDEIAKLARSFNEFIEKLQTMIRHIVHNAVELNGSVSDLSKLSDRMNQGAGTMVSKSTKVAAATDTMSTNMIIASKAMEEASVNMNMVAAATDEMHATVNQIAQNSEKARSITADAVSKTTHASNKVDDLGKAAQEIGAVTQTVNEISEQTNLLALNATIEAARAGESGKGFAVVANEIKELARQTATATLEIKKRVEDIQNSTGDTTLVIEQISIVIRDVNEIVSSIAAAVEEQSVASRDIADHVLKASTKIQAVTDSIAQNSRVSADIAKNLNELDHHAGEMSDISTKANKSTLVLTRLSEQLKEMMGRFKT